MAPPLYRPSEFLVWYVQGANPTEAYPLLFSTETSAEIYARIVFPEESEHQRRCRVYYRTVYNLETAPTPREV